MSRTKRAVQRIAGRLCILRQQQHCGYYMTVTGAMLYACAVVSAGGQRNAFDEHKMAVVRAGEFWRESGRMLPDTPLHIAVNDEQQYVVCTNGNPDFGKLLNSNILFRSSNLATKLRLVNVGHLENISVMRTLLLLATCMGPPTSKPSGDVQKIVKRGVQCRC